MLEAESEERAFARCRFAVQGAHSPRPSASRVVAENREESAMNDLCPKGAGELAGMIASGEIPSAEVVDAVWPVSTRSTGVNAATVTLADYGTGAGSFATACRAPASGRGRKGLFRRGRRPFRGSGAN